MVAPSQSLTQKLRCHAWSLVCYQRLIGVLGAATDPMFYINGCKHTPLGTIRIIMKFLISTTSKKQKQLDVTIPLKKSRASNSNSLIHQFGHAMNQTRTFFQDRRCSSCEGRWFWLPSRYPMAWSVNHRVNAVFFWPIMASYGEKIMVEMFITIWWLISWWRDNNCKFICFITVSDSSEMLLHHGDIAVALNSLVIDCPAVTPLPLVGLKLWKK